MSEYKLWGVCSDPDSEVVDWVEAESAEEAGAKWEPDFEETEAPRAWVVELTAVDIAEDFAAFCTGWWVREHYDENRQEDYWRDWDSEMLTEANAALLKPYLVEAVRKFLAAHPQGIQPLATGDNTAGQWIARTQQTQQQAEATDGGEAV